MAESRSEQDEANDITDTLRKLDEALLPDGDDDDFGDAEGDLGVRYDDDDGGGGGGDGGSTTPSDHTEEGSPSEHSTDPDSANPSLRDENGNSVIKDEESGETVALVADAPKETAKTNGAEGEGEGEDKEKDTNPKKEEEKKKKTETEDKPKNVLPPEVDRPEGSASALVLAEPKQRKSSLKRFFKLKRFSLKGRKEKAPTTRMQTMMQVKVESLPQIFITKYLGMRECKGLYGIKHTREPVDEMVQAVKESGDELPLLELRVSKSGIRIREHKANKSLNYNFDAGLVPIEFLSYGVQDTRFTRVFTFIVVREMSSRSKKMECHAYICDSSISARKLALSISLAFKQYSSSVKDKSNVFQVNLDKSKEAEDEADLAKQNKDCEA